MTYFRYDPEHGQTYDSTSLSLDQSTSIILPIIQPQAERFLRDPGQLSGRPLLFMLFEYSRKPGLPQISGLFYFSNFAQFLAQY
jgi:hypothetical protein